MSWVTEVDGLKHSFQGRCHRPLVKNCIHLVPPQQRLLFLRLQCWLFHLSYTSECSKLPKTWSLGVFSLGPLPQYYLMVLMVSYLIFTTSLHHLPGLHICMSTTPWTSLSRCLQASWTFVPVIIILCTHNFFLPIVYISENDTTFHSVAQAKNSDLSFPTCKCVNIIILSLRPKYPKPWYFSLPHSHSPRQGLFISYLALGKMFSFTKTFQSIVHSLSKKPKY